jgi:hypothetical protein
MAELRVEIVYYEYECGSPCTVNGCMGHDGPAVGLVINGEQFVNEDYARGDTIPNPEEVEAAVKAAVAKLLS